MNSYDSGCIELVDEFFFEFGIKIEVIELITLRACNNN